MLELSLIALLFAPSAFVHGTPASPAPVEHVTFDPAYLIVEQADGAPRATGMLEVEEVMFDQPMQVVMDRDS